jgi:DegV family protein with EDD domain
MGQGLLVWHADQLRKEGKSIVEIKNWINENKLNLCHLFTVDDLGTLKRGGRLSDTQAFLGSLLKIKPILHVSDEGKLVPLKKARGRDFSLESMVELMNDKIIEPKKQTIFISHGDCESEAKKVGALIVDKYQVKDIVYSTIGPVIGAHSGPGTIAVFFMGNKR